MYEMIVIFVAAFLFADFCFIIVNLFRLLWNWIYIMKRATVLTELFISVPKRKKEHNIIEQKASKIGRKQLKEFRKKHYHLPIRTKMIAVAKFFSHELSLLLQKLTPEESYSCTTHLLHQLEHAEKKQLLTIQHSQFSRKRIMLEACTLLGVRDFVRCLFDRRLRPLLRRNFYLVRFTKTSTKEEFPHERPE